CPLLPVLYHSSTRSGLRLDRFVTAPGRAAVPRSSRTAPGSVPRPQILALPLLSRQRSDFHLPRLPRARCCCPDRRLLDRRETAPNTALSGEPTNAVELPV